VAGVAGSVLLAAFGPSPTRAALVVPAFFWQLTDQLYPDRPWYCYERPSGRLHGITQQRPWTGWDYGISSLFGADARLAGSPSQFLLMLTAETGIPVAVLFCGWTVWVIFQGVQLLRNWPSVSAKV